MALAGHNEGFGCRRIPNILEAPSRRVFPQTWLKRKPSSWGKRRISWVWTRPRSFPRTAEKNKLLKNAWSRARMNKFVGVTEGEDIFLSKCLDSKSNLSRKRGVACRWVNLACNCSAVTDFKYSLTGKDAARLPKPSVASQSPCRPMERKLARSLPTYESTVL